MHSEWSSSTNRVSTGVICKTAFRTVPRCGVAGLLFLLIGFYLIFPACDAWRQLREERNIPYILSATTTKERIDLNALLQVEGVERVSPVHRMDSVLSVEDYTLQAEVQAVYPGFLDISFTSGTMFPESTNMPYLILNKEAAKSFSRDTNSVMTVSANTQILLRGNDTEQKALICGIFDDGNKSPVAYMSYDTASRTIPQSVSTEILLSLTNKGMGEKVVKSIRKLGLNASFDEDESMRWRLMKQQVWQMFLTGLGCTACAIILIRKNRGSELPVWEEEITSLLMSGMAEDKVNRIFPLRIFIAGISCLLLASAIAGAVGVFSFSAVGISAAFIIACMAVMFIRMCLLNEDNE